MTGPEAIRFVLQEARLLDEKRWDEWLELFAEDGVYWRRLPMVSRTCGTIPLSPARICCC